MVIIQLWSINYYKYATDLSVDRRFADEILSFLGGLSELTQEEESIVLCLLDFFAVCVVPDPQDVLVLIALFQFVCFF